MSEKQKISRSHAKLLNAWVEAADDLQLEIVPKFKLQIYGGRVIEFLLLIKSFGSHNGTLILSLDNLDDFDVPEQYGYYCSALNVKSYGKYSREAFIDTLEDWRYLGDPEIKPTWYTGLYED